MFVKASPIGLGEKSTVYNFIVNIAKQSQPVFHPSRTEVIEPLQGYSLELLVAQPTCRLVVIS